jgi:hypothetical protein
MRIHKNVGPYSGRQPKAKEPKAGNQLLRQASKQPDSKLPKNATVKGNYDVSDRYLRGQAGGEAHPFYDKHKAGR